jgi:DNA replication and repair protein RecF
VESGVEIFRISNVLAVTIMHIKELQAKSFRNYSRLHITFSPGINFIIGNNGAGKTNIIEAISILSNIKSFRNIHDSEIVQWGNDSYFCSASVADHTDAVFEVGCMSTTGGSAKRLKIDGITMKSAAEYYGRLLTVIFSPQDITIINGTPDIRRRFFDSVISKIDRPYMDVLGDFRKVLSSRNRLLKEMKSKRQAGGLEIWDALFSEKSAYLIDRRMSFISEFSRLFQRHYSTIAADEAPEIRYQCSAESADSALIYRKLTALRSRDILLGSTGIGPQRDDYVLENKKKNKFVHYASQGQVRTAAVTLKVAECGIIEGEKNKKSVILMDDIFSELDEIRRSRIIDVLHGGNQIIFTMVHFDPVALHNFGEYRGFRVEAPGKVGELMK